jgi:hypothetical protein
MALSESIQKLIPLDSPDEWSKALEGIPHSFTHTREHCYAMYLTTGLPTFLYTLAQGNIRIVCPITERRYGKYVEATTPPGFSGFTGTGDLAGFPEIWNRFANDRGYITTFITLNPLFARPSFTNPAQTRQHNTLHFLDLHASEEENFARLSRSRRRAIRQWEESGVSIVEDRQLLTRFFLDRYPEFFRRENMADAYNFSESTLKYLLSLDKVYMVGAATSSGLQMALIGCQTPYVVDGLLSVSVPEAGGHMAGLVWHAAKHFRNLGIPLYNLGGEIDSRPGISSFKRHFGTREMPLRSLRLVVQPVIYNELCAAAGCAAQSDGFFPPYQQKTTGRYLHVQQGS